MSCGLTTSKYFLQNDGYPRAENYQPGNYCEQDAVSIYGEREHDERFHAVVDLQFQLSSSETLTS
ncbi:MAG TPA: hypothetical protein VF397_16970 [Pyrinomonadaceae bacterium]